MIDLAVSPTQTAFGDLVGISQPAVSDLVSRGILRDGESAQQWLWSYTSHLREMAAGRATEGGLDLATERARLASEQADRVAMQNAVTRRDLAPVAFMEACLAQVGRQIASKLEAIPVNLKMRSTSISEQDLTFVEQAISEARNAAAGMKLDWSELDGPAIDMDREPERD